MEDRYLCKAKRIDNGEWVEGYLIKAKKDFYICEYPYECINGYSSVNGQFYGFGGFKAIDPSTICQCPGLTDKNGKKIWENDIVKTTNSGIGIIKFGLYNSKHYGFYIKWVEDFDYREDIFYWCNNHFFTIVGNALDYPELLEGELKMKKYRCKKDFTVDKCDGNGFMIENDYVNVKKGEIYTLDEEGRRIAGGEVHLDNDNGGWLEICKENLEKFFEEIQEKIPNE